MHKYLRAIGFSKCKNRDDVQKVLQAVCKDPNYTSIVNEDSDIYGYISRSFGKNMGVKLVGVYDSDHHFHEDYYFPYVESDLVSSTLPLEVEKHSDRLAYGGIIDDAGMGIALIFYLNNGIELASMGDRHPREVVESVSLNALCTSGKILLPIYKTDDDCEKMKVTAKERSKLMEAARNGDETAIENLAMEDMAILRTVSERITREDIYSLVDTCFMPYGLESDQYSVLGEIRQVEKITNRMTGEMLWQLTLECNHLLLTVMINADDLLGEPAVGRRFKGEIWLQGTAKLKEK